MSTQPRKCYLCKETKPSTDFYLDRTRRGGGYSSRCKKCEHTKKVKKGSKLYDTRLKHAKKQYLRRKNNGGKHSQGEWETLKAQYNWTCPSCKKQEPTIKLSRDHIIPSSKGGSNNIENIQPLCLPCNVKKNTNIIKYERN